MREELLHFIWRFRYFNQQQLFTESGAALQILSPGEYHSDQGPDFRNAQIRIGDRLCEGPVELHVLASDWVRHAHDGDVHYRDTILHVVWINDWTGREGLTGTPGNIPILTLQQRVPKLLLSRYERWMKSETFLPCERQLLETGSHIAGVSAAWLQELAVRRLRRRALLIGEDLKQNRQHWEETMWIHLARSMGQAVNADAFEAIARSLKVEWMVRLRSERPALEALLLGQAGLLDGKFCDDYPLALQREYRFLRVKWGLSAPVLPISFLRMRPAHFPTIRLAQLAALMADGIRWFACVREAGSPAAVMEKLHVDAGSYWETHYRPDKPVTARPRRLGIVTRQGLLINAFIPLLFAYGWLREEPAFTEKALCWLRELPPEKNSLISRWRQLGLAAVNAADTQALLELKKHYCVTRRCLDCAIGRVLLGQEGETFVPPSRVA